MDIFAEALNVEQNYYQEGYEEGYTEGEAQGLLEGRQFGIQTGFQRYLAIGVLQARVDHWQSQQMSDKARKHLNQLQKYLQEIPMTNAEHHADSIAKLLVKAKVKAKMIQSSLKDSPVELYDQSLDLKNPDETIEELKIIA